MKNIKTRTDLAYLYDVSPQIISKWVKEIKHLNLKKSQKLYTPNQIKIIIEYLGEPYIEIIQNSILK